MKKQILRFTLYVIIIYLTGTVLNPVVAATQPSEGNRIHFCGVDGQWNKQYSDQFASRHYARAADLNVSEPFTVRVILFHPSDHRPRSDIDTVLDTLVKRVQQFYADEMERHGFGRKTFRLEIDIHGKIVVHRVEGKFNNAYYDGNAIDLSAGEVSERFDTTKNINLVWIDLNLDDPINKWSQVGGKGGGGAFGGSAWLSATGFDDAPPQLYIRAFGVMTHELGHAFGLDHDFRDDRYTLSYGAAVLQDQLSRCAAEWLDVHRYFNTNQTSLNEPPTIQMLPPSLASPPNTIRFQFEVTDPDGLHQAQLLTNSLSWGPTASPELLDCKSLNGNSATIGFDTTELALGSEYVVLKVIDVSGDFTSQNFPIDISSLLSDSNPVSIPDPNLAAAIRESLRLASRSAITQLDMLGLQRLETPQKQITDLTGLQHAFNLQRVDLSENRIVDLTPLAGLAKLRSLLILRNKISDISPLAGLTQLSTFWIWDNQISDISPLAGLKNLVYLEIGGNQVSNLASLEELKNLVEVGVELNPLSYLSIHTHIPTLQSRGVTVRFFNQAHPALLKISGDNQTGAAFVSLSQPLVVEAQDRNGSVLAGISVTFAVTRGGGTLSTTNTITDENGRARSTLILGPNLGANTVEVSAAGIESPATFYAIADSELPPMRADVNHDGLVNVLDLIVIASSLGQSGQHDGDVNGDRVVNILDLVLAAGVFEETAAAPSAQPQVPETLTAVEVHGWLTNARSLEPKDPIMKRGFAVLEQLLVSLTPKETELLANYPNPFNPETWIPYRLAEDAFVTLTIYDGSGRVVRTLNVGHRIAAVYENRSKATYWDGRNGLGEQVASGVYFYHLSAGDYSTTRKMVILK